MNWYEVRLCVRLVASKYIHAVASHFTDWTVLYVCVCDPVCVFFNTK